MLDTIGKGMANIVKGISYGPTQVFGGISKLGVGGGDIADGIERMRNW